MKLLKGLKMQHVKALLNKDFLVRMRKPWMTLLQYVWPTGIFLALYVFRKHFSPIEVQECQFPTRQLPSNGLLPFFQSYICSIENQCTDPRNFEETTMYENAPVTPVVNIIQTILNEDVIFNAIKDLPIDKNFLSAVTSIATHKQFHIIEENIQILIQKLPEFEKLVGDNFDIKKLFSDDRMFSKSGNILCGRPFPRSDNIRYVENLFWTEDFSGADDDEIQAMPTKYCKQLYLDVTNTNQGKITWKTIKPIIQGKILYGPKSERNDAIMKYANETFVEVSKLKVFLGSINTTLSLLHTDEEFIKSLNSIISLAKSPIVQAIIGRSVDTDLIESMVDRILNDPRISETIEIIMNIFDCYSVDRFVTVNSEKELEDEAFKLNEKKMFYAAVYLTDQPDDNQKNYSYKVRMELDNTPVTLYNQNRYWFPEPEASFELDMRYHRGFIQIQQSVDNAIIKYERKVNGPIAEAITEASVESEEENSESTSSFDASDSSEEDSNTTSADLAAILSDIGSKIKVSQDDLNKHADDGSALDDFLDFRDEEEKVEEVKNRSKRAPQFEGLLSFFGGGDKANSDADNTKYQIDDIQFFTKQFPYPKYIKDDFKKGLYLAQAVQMGFFFALIVQVTSTVRQRIWMKESGNSTLMRAMGLSLSSENIAWFMVSMLELAIIFVLVTIVFYGGGILIFSGKLFIYIYLLVFGMCLVSFCYMCTTFFSSASIGSVSTAIFFLITYLPYIIIISLGATLGVKGKFFACLSFSTAFCYAWNFIMRAELQHFDMGFKQGFTGSITENDFLFSFLMIILDTFIYLLIGFIHEKLTYDENKFYEVERQNLDKDTGAYMKSIVKVYDGNKRAVNNVSLTFRKDEVTCLLGRNGAGKSTIIKILTGQVLQTSGDVFLPLNYDIITGLTNDQEKVGLCPQNNILIPDLTAKEHLELYAKIKIKYGFNNEIKRILNCMNLGKYVNYKSEELSGGYKRRLCIAIAFLGSPNLVILDEPCSGVDTKARKNIWDLIEVLRKGRAVVLATHHLDEAEHLSDNVVILKEGEIVSRTTHTNLKEIFTKTFMININFTSPIDKEKSNLLDKIKNVFNEHLPSIEIDNFSEYSLGIKVPYCDSLNGSEQINFEPIILSLQKLKTDKEIISFNVISKNLDEMFDSFNKVDLSSNGISININNNDHSYKSMTDNKFYDESNIIGVIGNLFKKRFLHFKRNYWMLLCILVLPAVFEIIAMGCMILRPPGERDNSLEFSKDLYAGSTEFYSNEKHPNYLQFTQDVFEEASEGCGGEYCHLFNSSRKASDWILRTEKDYIGKRYGGLTFNNSKAIVWYNNKGYHAMTTYLNILNSAILKRELNDSSYNIRTSNHPLQLGEGELSTSSILQLVADAGIALILLLSFSLVLAAASVFIVNERVHGEKLQQRLCGINFTTYWGVTFIWDFLIYVTAVLIAVVILKIFAIPIYVDKDQLIGIVTLLLFYGFASIPCVHVFEKMFSEASFSIMCMFCMNFIIAASTLTVIIMFDILGETDEAERIRNFLNRFFLIFPQHGLADGLIEICQNYIKAQLFHRYYIDTYKSPFTILQPHFISLTALGIFFIILNCLLENKVFVKFWNKLHSGDKIDENRNGDVCMKDDQFKFGVKYDVQTNDDVLRIINLSKKYSKNYAIKNVSMNVKQGECFGLLGINGAGKSTIFSILSGQSVQTSGTVEFLNKNGISYCPQYNPLDALLTVEEVIRFYGKLRKIRDLENLTTQTLQSFHLEQYRNVLVKNLSGGNRRKLSVACTCFGRTDIVLMDEPTSDMDPLTRLMVYNTIDRLIKARRTVLLTSHRISEIEKICRRIAVINDGKIISTGTPNELNHSFGNSYVITIFSSKSEDSININSITKDFSSARCVMRHNHSIQFTLKVKYEESSIIENGYDREEHLLLSDVFKRLHAFSKEHNVAYTISECQLDQIFENILDKNDNSYLNNAYSHETESETNT